jgi:hypothetical protein
MKGTGAAARAWSNLHLVLLRPLRAGRHRISGRTRCCLELPPLTHSLRCCCCCCAQLHAGRPAADRDIYLALRSMTMKGFLQAHRQWRRGRCWQRQGGCRAERRQQQHVRSLKQLHAKRTLTCRPG